MLVLMQPALARAASVVSAPTLIELPGLVFHASGESLTDSTLVDTPATNTWNMALTNSGVTLTTGIGGRQAWDIANGQNIRIGGDDAKGQFIGGRNSWIFGARVYLPSSVADGFHTIYDYGVDTRGQTFGVQASSGTLTLRLKSKSAAFANTNIDGPTITADTWWFVWCWYDVTTGKVMILRVDDGSNVTSVESSVLTERDCYGGGTMVFGSVGGSSYLLGQMCDVYYAKGAESLWGTPKILELYNGGELHPDLDDYEPPESDGSAEAAPFGSVTVISNALATGTTGSKGIYWIRPWRMPSGQLRWFYSIDHGGQTDYPNVYTGTSADPLTLPASWSTVPFLHNTTTDGPGGSGTRSIAVAETPSYLYAPGVVTDEPHLMFVNYTNGSWSPSISGISDLEELHVYSSATEDFASPTWRGIAFGGKDDTYGGLADRFYWMGYHRIFEPGVIPGTTNYAAYGLKDLTPPDGLEMYNESASPLSFALDNDTAIHLDFASKFPARFQMPWGRGIFVAGTGVYSLGRARMPGGRGIAVARIGQDSNSKYTRPTGDIWAFGPLDTDVYPTVGYTQEVLPFWENDVLYGYKTRGFYASRSPFNGIEDERVDILYASFPGEA